MFRFQFYVYLEIGMLCELIMDVENMCVCSKQSVE